jgi:hypothetical protein
LLLVSKRQMALVGQRRGDSLVLRVDDDQCAVGGGCCGGSFPEHLPHRLDLCSGRHRGPVFVLGLTARGGRVESVELDNLRPERENGRTEGSLYTSPSRTIHDLPPFVLPFVPASSLPVLTT